MCCIKQMDSEYKKLKDPIYGYIKIPTELIKRVIDTAVFQRLRRVLQTSYAPLFSSAIHNRFVHSIGVFYLGCIASEQLKKEILKKNLLTKKDAEKYVHAYQLACLLHDVGHAPFSHTGENFYKTKDYYSTELHHMLREEVGVKAFDKDIPAEESQAAAPHEIMSAVIGLREFGGLLPTKEEKELFARCITGYQYKTRGSKNEIKNCFVTMLNSKVIDVDRLDYLIRDAYITGFKTVDLDYERLLNALTIVNEREIEESKKNSEKNSRKNSESSYIIAYKKDALSVIENVVFAHDAEKKWIQSHPVVLYESYLLQHIISYLNQALDDGEHRLFSINALSKEGVNLKQGVHISLLCDDDIVYLFKNVCSDTLSEEYFAREKRRHPVWKSEAEYKAYINRMSDGGEIKDSFSDCLQSFIEGDARGVQMPIVINPKLEEKLEREKEDAEQKLADAKNRIDRDSFSEQRNGTLRKLSLCRFLNRYADEHGLEKDFVILKASMFTSNFSKEDIQNIPIVFSLDGDEFVKRAGDVCSLLNSEGVKEDFYYLFYRETDGNRIQSKKKFCEQLYFAALNMQKVE